MSRETVSRLCCAAHTAAAAVYMIRAERTIAAKKSAVRLAEAKGMIAPEIAGEILDYLRKVEREGRPK